MLTSSQIQILGLIASIILPLFNIPLMIRILKRKSSDDLSLVWALGVWSCLILMIPSGWISEDFVFKVFTIVNITLFSGVVFLVLFFRIRKKK